MTQSSFYSDTPNYAEDYPAPDDGAPTNGNTPAPSSFYQSGASYSTVIPEPGPSDPTGATNAPSSFYGAAANYAADFPAQNDSNTQPTIGNTQAPSSFYPGGTTYAYLAEESHFVAEVEAQRVAAETAAAASASSASASAASAAEAATTLADGEAAIDAALASLEPSDATPLMDGTAAPGTSVQLSRGDHRHPTDTSRAAVTYVDAADALSLWPPRRSQALLRPLRPPLPTTAPRSPPRHSLR